MHNRFSLEKKRHYVESANMTWSETLLFGYIISIQACFQEQRLSCDIDRKQQPDRRYIWQRKNADKIRM